MDREYVYWDSPSLGRKMELLWFGWGGRPMIWFPTSKGRFYQSEDFGLIDAVADLIAAGLIRVACVDSVDDESFYATHQHPAQRLRRHDQYDHYLRTEVVPWIAARVGSAAGCDPDSRPRRDGRARHSPRRLKRCSRDLKKG